MWSAGPLTAEKYASLCGNGVEVELTYPRKQAYCGKNCRMDQRILLDGLQGNRVHDIRMAEQTPALFAKAERNGGPVSIVSAF
jgi:hypothetical protein